jgi:NADPH:quinone reductase-like Zn-dependent oxidoreductase
MQALASRREQLRVRGWLGTLPQGDDQRLAYDPATGKPLNVAYNSTTCLFSVSPSAGVYQAPSTRAGGEIPIADQYGTTPPEPNPMHAIIIREYGGSEKLTRAEIEAPKPGEGDVQIRVRAAGVNPVDWKIRRGMLRWVVRFDFPLVLGFDVAGEVAAVGRDVTRFREGDSVYAMLQPPRAGGYAELAVAPKSAVARKAVSQTDVEAASMPVAALTALQALRDLGGLKAGQSVLINGASGGVGTFAVQIARALGARATGVCGPSNVGLVRELGADEAIDYKKEDFTSRGEKYDMVFDAVARSTFSKCRRILTPSGTYVSTLPTAGLILRSMVLQPVLALAGVKRQARMIVAKPRGEDLSLLAELADAGKLKPVIDRVYPLEQAREAHDYSETGRARGKIVLQVS